MKLYAWQPNGHGELSWFVIAYSEEKAKEDVEREMNRLMNLPLSDINRISTYECGGWGTDYYTLTVADVGTVITNQND